MNSNERKQLLIFYLFMGVDGERSPSEKQYFNEICEKMKISDYDKKTIIKECNDVKTENSLDNSATIIKKISEILGGETSNSSFARIWDIYLNTLNANKSSQLFTIWTLINLAYADKKYTEPEKRVVKYLVNRWSINSTVFYELIDTADTMLALTKQKEWIKTTDKSYDEKSSLIKKIDEDIKLLFNNMEVTISEAEVALAN